MPAPALAAIRLWKCWWRLRWYRTSAPRSCCASMPNCIPKIRGRRFGARCRMPKARKAAFMISAVAEQYQLHPQTLRLYEREGLLKPSRTEGNTRLYTEQDIERLELILSLTRNMGVNLAGVEVVLNMRQKMEQMQAEMQEFVAMVQREFGRQPTVSSEMKNALVRFVPPA